jgi:predicted  nucleic acid-binding Zn-ribbon protein
MNRTEQQIANTFSQEGLDSITEEVAKYKCDEAAKCHLLTKITARRHELLKGINAEPASGSRLRSIVRTARERINERFRPIAKVRDNGDIEIVGYERKSKSSRKFAVRMLRTPKIIPAIEPQMKEAVV